MSWQTDAKEMSEAGFSDQELSDYAARERQRGLDAGFSGEEMDQYFGIKPFKHGPVKQLLDDNHKEATASTSAEGQPKPVTNWQEAIEAGLQMSVSGLLVRGKKPDLALTDDAPRSSRIAANVASLAGDVPAMLGGFAVGGGPVTGTAAAFALPAGMRKVLMDKYQNGEVRNFGEFWDRLSGTLLETGKAWVTGAATGLAGKVAGTLPIANPFGKGAAVTSAELGTMVAVGNALEGKIPEPNDFVDAAIALGFVKASYVVAGKLRTVYAKTGVRPEEVFEHAKHDPTIHQDLSSSNIDIPRSYEVALRATALKVKDEIPLPAKPAANTEAPKKAAPSNALAQIGDHISTTPQVEKPMTWQDLYTKAVDDLNPIREAVKKAEKINPKSTEVEQVQGEIVGEGSATLRKDPLLESKPQTLLAGETPALLEGPREQGLAIREQGGGNELAKSEGGAVSTEFMTARTGSPTGKAEDAHPLEGVADPYKLMRLLRGSLGKAAHFLEHGTTDFNTYKTNGESLRDILKPVKDLDGFRNFIVAQRATELHSRGIESGIKPELAESAVAEGKGRFKADADRLVQYQNRVTRYLRDSGIISSEQYDAMLEANKMYVPFFRLLDSNGGGIGKGLNVKNPIKAIEGSSRMIIDPLESVIKNTYVYTALAERNAAGSAFIKMADKTGEAGKFYKDVPPDTMKVELTEPEIKRLFKEFVEIKKTESETKKTAETVKGSSSSVHAEGSAEESKPFRMVKGRVLEALKARGFSDGEAQQMIGRLMANGGKSSETITESVERVSKIVERTVFEPELNIRLPNKAATVFRAVREPLRPNEIAVFENGKRIVYSLDPDVAAAFKSLDTETANLFVKIISIPATTLRAGAVLSPDFMARNALRDQLSAAILSKGGYFPIFDFVRGAMSLIKKDDAFGNWLKSGGANSAMVSVDRQYLQEHLFQLSKETGLMERAWNVTKSPLEMLRVASELIENSTRLGEFKRVSGGRTDKASLQEAAFSSREVTLDFARIGANMRAINMIAAFSNAQVQGLDRVVRGFAESPVGMSAKVAASITMPSLLLWWANHEDPRWKDIPNWQKDLFWIAMTKDTIYRIPKPFELGVIFGSLPERAMEGFFAHDPNAFKDFEKSMIGAFLPNLTPQIAQPIIEQFSNRSLFTGSPIIPSSSEKLLPEYQYNEYTTELAKAIGSMIGSFPGIRDRAIEDDQTFIGGMARALSTPALVENYTRAWTGGLGSYMLQIADKGLREANVLPDPILPTATLADIPLVKAFVIRYPSASVQSIQDFYNDFSAADRYRVTIETLSNQGDEKAAQLAETYPDKMVDLSSMQATLTDQHKLIRMIYKNPDIPADEKRQLIDTLYFTMIEIAHAGNDAMREIKSIAHE